jgi:hypothetical protein
MQAAKVQCRLKVTPRAGAQTRFEIGPSNFLINLRWIVCYYVKIGNTALPIVQLIAVTLPLASRNV